MMVETDGKQLTVPVEKKIGKMFDFFGNTIDHEKPLSLKLKDLIYTNHRHH
jgi:F0F1-type ATP synthase beta subunit